MASNELLGTTAYRENLQAAFRRLTYVIPAGNFQKIDFTGTYIKVVSASVAVSNIEVEIDQSGRWLPEVGLEYQFMPYAYRRVTIYNNDALPQTVVILLGYGDCRDPGSISTIVGTVTLSKATVLDTITDVVAAAGVATQILPALATRRSAILTNLDAATALRFGDSNVTATRGTRVSAGQAIIIDTTEAIFAFNASGAPVNVSVTWTAD